MKNLKKEFTEKEKVLVSPMFGNLKDEFEIFLSCANDGKGRDITNNLKPLPTFEEWLRR